MKSDLTKQILPVVRKSVASHLLDPAYVTVLSDRLRLDLDALAYFTQDPADPIDVTLKGQAIYAAALQAILENAQLLAAEVRDVALSVASEDDK